MKYLFLIFFSFPSLACQFKENRPVISLSGPISYLLKELDLLKEQQVKAVSLFHGLTIEEFKGDRIGGGIFLAPDYLKKFPNPLIFFDESQEFRKNIANLELDVFEIKTRNLDPFLSFLISKDALLPHLKGCEKRISLVQSKVNEIKDLLKTKKPLKKTYVFYLGEVKNKGRKPNLVMVDNFVLYFKQQSLLKTYPTELNYAPWSEKVMNELKQNASVEIGLVNGGGEALRTKNVAINQNNFIQRAILIPGLPQVYLLPSLYAELEKLDH